MNESNNIVLTEQIPDDIPEWAIKAMADQVFFKTAVDRIAGLEDEVAAYRQKNKPKPKKHSRGFYDQPKKPGSGWSSRKSGAATSKQR